METPVLPFRREPKKPPAQSHVVVLGAARNVEHSLVRQVRKFDRAFASFRKISYVVSESDSSDRTLEILERLKKQRENFYFVSLGKLEPECPLRMQRLVRARNAALEFCRESPALEDADYIAVADWDGVNLRLTARGVESCWKIEGWDIVTANQPEGYYDIWSLRHKAWCPGDCWAEYRQLEQELGSSVAFEIAVGSKRIRIPDDHSPIAVECAFGGLAIYKRDVYLGANYSLPPDGEPEVCEHVSFHAALRAQGARIIINSALVNMVSCYDHLPLLSLPRLKVIARHQLARFARRMKPVSAAGRGAAGNDTSAT